MKKIANGVRIGMVPRGNVSSNLDSNIEDKINHQPEKEQQLTTPDNHIANVKDTFHDQPQVSRFASPNNVRFHDLNELNTNKQPPTSHTQEMQSNLSVSSVHPEQQQPFKDLNQIPSKAKWSATKKFLVGTSAAALVAGCITIATVLPILLTQSAGTTTTLTASTSSSTTTVAPTVISVYWSFDNTVADLSNTYNGTLNNGATFTLAGSSTLPYYGNGQALILNSASSQSFSVSTPIFNLSYTSFTIEAWIYSSTLVGDRGIFGQCQCTTCANQCLFFICRNNRLYVGFTLNDLSGNATMQANTWYHVAFVYNNQTQQQILYLNGVQDTIKSNAAAYQGKNVSIQIGSTQVYSAINYFSGYIDNLIVTTRAKSSTEILSDASIMVYYSFDLPNPYADSSQVRITGNSSNTVTITGRVNQAMRFTGTNSYFQAYGFNQFPYGITTNKTFSVSMWIFPTSTSSATFVQTFATNLNANWCMDMLGVYSPGATMGQLFVMSGNNLPAAMTGPFLSQNTWSHISLTYSSANGYSLYFNGIYFGATGNNVVYTSSTTFAYLFIGYYSTCSQAATAFNFGYQGSIDEFYIHNRELTQSDVTGLANP